MADDNDAKASPSAGEDQLGFHVSDGDPRVLHFSEGVSRPATATECALWDALQAHDASREALAELVALEDLKGLMAKNAATPGQSDSYELIDEYGRMSADYATRRQVAWTAARAAIASCSPLAAAEGGFVPNQKLETLIAAIRGYGAVMARGSRAVGGAHLAAESEALAQVTALLSRYGAQPGASVIPGYVHEIERDGARLVLHLESVEAAGAAYNGIEGVHRVAVNIGHPAAFPEPTQRMIDAGLKAYFGPYRRGATVTGADLVRHVLHAAFKVAPVLYRPRPSSMDGGESALLLAIDDALLAAGVPATDSSGARLSDPDRIEKLRALSLHRPESGSSDAADAARLAAALQTATAAIYFADGSDYLRALWEVVRELDPEIAALLKADENDAYNRTVYRYDMAKERLAMEGHRSEPGEGR